MRIGQTLWLLAVTVAAANGAERRDWNAVTQAPRGAQVEVIHSGLKRARGVLVEATAESITVQAEAGPTSIARADVSRVSILKRLRMNRTLVGAAIGAGVGAAAMALGAHS